MKRSKVFAVFLAVLMLLGSFGSAQAAPLVTYSPPKAESEMFSDRDLDSSFSNCMEIALSDADGDVLINTGGTYCLTGELAGGGVRISCPDTDTVQLVLDGVSISNSGSAALYVKSADKVFITLAPGSENRLESIGVFNDREDGGIDGAIFARCDTTINGSGSLSVSSASGHGIASKDDLKICGGSISVESAKQALSGKDSIRIGGGSIYLSSGKDALHSEHGDADKGYIYIRDGKLDIAAGDQGVFASGGIYIAGGQISISRSEEGIEGRLVSISGGELDIISADDGINASEDDDGPRGLPCVVGISGGSVTINAGGDGIDSNGFLEVSGGSITVHGPTRGDNGAFDYEYGGSISGGSFAALSGRGMNMNFGADSTQPSICGSFSAPKAAGEELRLTDSNGRLLLSLTAKKDWQCAVISLPELELGETYTLSAGEESLELTADENMYGNGGFGPGPGGMGRGGMGFAPAGYGGQNHWAKHPGWDD